MDSKSIALKNIEYVLDSIFLEVNLLNDNWIQNSFALP